MRRSLAAFAAVLVLPACGAQEPAPAPPPATDFAAPPEATKAFADRFAADSASASWKDKVVSSVLSGRAILVRTSLAKGDKAMATAMCEAAYSAAKATVPDNFVSVTVRSAKDNSVSWLNTMRGETACKS